jgi:hypothetical protein
MRGEFDAPTGLIRRIVDENTKLMDDALEKWFEALPKNEAWSPSGAQS